MSAEDSDQDNDELDLIGSSAFSRESERRQLYTASANASEQDMPLQTVSADTAEEPAVEDISMEDQEGLVLERSNAEIKAETAGADNIPLLQPNEMPNGRKGLDDSTAIIDALSDKKCSPMLLIPRNLPIKIELPPIIREDIIIPVPLNPIGGQVYHIDTSVASESLEPPISPVHYRQQYDPQYRMPPLSILPAEFSRKTKTTKRKKEKERDKSDSKKDRDEILPMGVSRWGATVLANPVWKRVSRATKCLSTREWGVCLYNYPNPSKYS